MKPPQNPRKTPVRGLQKDHKRTTEKDPLADLVASFDDVDLDGLFDDLDVDAILADLAEFDLDALLESWGSDDLAALLDR